MLSEKEFIEFEKLFEDLSEEQIKELSSRLNDKINTYRKIMTKDKKLMTNKEWEIYNNKICNDLQNTCWICRRTKEELLDVLEEGTNLKERFDDVKHIKEKMCDIVSWMNANKNMWVCPVCVSFIQFISDDGGIK